MYSFHVKQEKWLVHTNKLHGYESLNDSLIKICWVVSEVNDSITHTFNYAFTVRVLYKQYNCFKLHIFILIFESMGAWKCVTYHKIKLLSGNQGFLNLQINKCMRRVTEYVTPWKTKHERRLVTFTVSIAILERSNFSRYYSSDIFWQYWYNC